MPVQLHTHFIDKLAFLNGIVSGFALYPQVFNVLYNGASTDFSTLSLVLICINSAVWMLYAVHRHLISLFLASLLNEVAAVLLLSLYFL